ncbi:hypothetical protein SKAU_G00412800 [Synaphobranchus kaupii]|uniref:Uncharacterized protein n=1 Tax=Synaphobranchus kaupii TaxID=118154 RepID=A0A9Q1IBX7_SYNKA|nr:hypothetical protein SKAU_G00412800 [Synaphobranchus kaupii]
MPVKHCFISFSQERIHQCTWRSGLCPARCCSSRERPASSPWETYLYQKRKNEGKILKTPVCQLSQAQQEKTRQQWRSYQKKHRALDKIMNFTPESYHCCSIVLNVECAVLF